MTNNNRSATKTITKRILLNFKIPLSLKTSHKIARERSIFNRYLKNILST
jgi:hypothetical protein